MPTEYTSTASRCPSSQRAFERANLNTKASSKPSWQRRPREDYSKDNVQTVLLSVPVLMNSSACLPMPVDARALPTDLAVRCSRLRQALMKTFDDHTGITLQSLQSSLPGPGMPFPQAHRSHATTQDRQSSSKHKFITYTSYPPFELLLLSGLPVPNPNPDP